MLCLCVFVDHVSERNTYRFESALLLHLRIMMFRWRFWDYEILAIDIDAKGPEADRAQQEHPDQVHVTEFTYFALHRSRDKQSFPVCLVERRSGGAVWFVPAR